MDEKSIAVVWVRNYGSGRREEVGVGLKKHPDGKVGQLGDGWHVESDNNTIFFKKRLTKMSDLEGAL